MGYDPYRHHRHSTRLKEYDYSSEGAYFVTVCVEHRECLLGQVIDGDMTINDWGRVVEDAWKEVAEHWPAVELDAFVVMPNHFHGIVILHTEADGTGKEGGGTLPLQSVAGPTLGAVVAYWKYQTSKKINQIRQTPGLRLWQRNYYDRIIRSEQMLDKARHYVACNPARWAEDTNNPVNL